MMGAENENTKPAHLPPGGQGLAMLLEAAHAILGPQVDPDRSLISQGMDSMAAGELVEALRSRGYEIDYSLLMGGASIHELTRALREGVETGPVGTLAEVPDQPMAVTGPQTIWALLDQQGWGTWANLSLCVSIPASELPAALLPAMVQSLCDANDALRMVLVQPQGEGEPVRQRSLSDYHVNVLMETAPEDETEVMRRFEAFEGEPCSPFGPSTRALVLSAAPGGARHWLCLSMHHAFVDREAIHSLARQLKEMISAKQMQAAPPALRYADYARWDARNRNAIAVRDSQEKLQALLSRTDTSINRPPPRLADREADPGALPSTSELHPAICHDLTVIAVQLGTTLPLLLHALFQVLAARLTGDRPGLSGESDLLLCHVISNRERFSSLRPLVGCLDTSVPVAITLNPGMTLQALATRVQKAFAQAFACAASLPRGEWFGQADGTREDEGPIRLFERVPHINILRRQPEEEEGEGFRVHRIRRVQQTRWGLLLRVALPSQETGARLGTGAVSASADSSLGLSVLADDRPLAIAAHFCLVELIRALTGEPRNTVGNIRVLELVNRLVDRAVFAAGQVRRAAALVTPGSSAHPFIWSKLIERQRRWYEHDDRLQLRRDAHSRFIGTPFNPFPFTQLDKLAERDYLEKLGAPLPRLLQVLAREKLPEALTDLAPSLPPSFVIKPVGAGHSFGVTIVREGKDLTRGRPFDPAIVAKDLLRMADRGYCLHEGRRFPFNFSSFLVEAFVYDECGYEKPTDYKVYVNGASFLWAQLQFEVEGQAWVAFVDQDGRPLPQPGWDPATCWRTHRALVCTEPSMMEGRKPPSWPSLVKHSSQLGSKMRIFARLDWYADATRGPLLGELTLFPHLLQPRSFYSSWANSTVRGVWQDPDGVAHETDGPTRQEGLGMVHFESRLCRPEPPASLLDFFPEQDAGPWSSSPFIGYRQLRSYVEEFDLAAWGLPGGACVALLSDHGVAFAGLLLATMYRYLALPLDASLPVEAIEQALHNNSAVALLALEGSPEARKARELSGRVPGLQVIVLTPADDAGLPGLPSPAPDGLAPLAKTAPCGPESRVLILHTSGTTGEPRRVSFTLSRLVRAGALIAQSLDLSPRDHGLSMLPLHRVGGIACNLVAPLVAGSPMRFCRAFDPRIFFESLEGANGTTWCYLVPSHWMMLLQYADEHPELRKARPWPRLRAIRSAGADLPHALALRLSQLFGDKVRVLPTYGMTEAMPIASPPIEYKLEKPGSVGRALPGVSIEIVNSSGHGSCVVLPDGMVGEITVAGPTVMSGYEGWSPAPDADFTPRGYLRTGDLGRLDADGTGWLYITDRLKHMINRGGETISPSEVERALRDFPGFESSEFMVFSRKHEQLQESVALAVAPPSTPVELENLRSWAGRRLPLAALPQTLVLVSSLPKSDSGKLLRTRFIDQVCQPLAPARLDERQTFILEGDALILTRSGGENRAITPVRVGESGNGAGNLESVLEVVREYLKSEGRLDPDTRFDEAGINSLAAVELSHRLGRRLGVELSPWIISDYPTPRALLSHLQSLPFPRRHAEPAGPTGVDGPAASSPAPSSGSQAWRVLMLHGEGADSKLMNLSMQATYWTQGFSSRLQFKYMDAPHPCAPKPEFHPRAVEIGLYNKPAYRTWGVINRDLLDQSVAAVHAAIDKLGPIDAIGGICDGGLVAALIASQRPNLKLYLNFASSPFNRLPEGLRDEAWTIKCPSLHLISARDEVLSMEELLDIPSRCERALLLRHAAGHAVPSLDPDIERHVIMMLNAASEMPSKSEDPPDQEAPPETKAAGYLT